MYEDMRSPYSTPEELEEELLDIYSDLDDVPGYNRSAVNREDRVNRINPQLGCSICPPNRGENIRHHSAKNRIRNQPKKARAKERAKYKDVKQYPKEENIKVYKRTIDI